MTAGITGQLTWLPLFFLFSYFMALLRPFIPDLTLTTENASESHIYIRKIKDSIQPAQGGKKVRKTDFQQFMVSSTLHLYRCSAIDISLRPKLNPILPSCRNLNTRLNKCTKKNKNLLRTNFNKSTNKSILMVLCLSSLSFEVHFMWFVN